MAQRLRVLAALADDPKSVDSTPVRLLGKPSVTLAPGNSANTSILHRYLFTYGPHADKQAYTHAYKVNVIIKSR